MSYKFNSIIDLVMSFDTEEKCLNQLVQWRWNGEPECLRCQSKNVCKFNSSGITSKRYKCRKCYYQFTATTGTIFHSSKLPLIKWYMAIYLNSSDKKGISSYQLANEIDVAQHTAWFMLTKIRQAYKDNDPTQLEGVVMCDETFVGGKNKNRHLDKKVKRADSGRMYADKITVLGMMELGGKVKTVAISQPTALCIKPHVYKDIKAKSIIVSDDWAVYQSLNPKYEYEHQMVRHAKKEYMNDCGFTTNPLEGYWASIKRTYIGTYHTMSRKHIQRYLDEISFRYNTRHMEAGERLNLIMGRISFKLTQKDIINEKEIPDILTIPPKEDRRAYQWSGKFIGKFKGRNRYGEASQEIAPFKPEA